jgi:translation initiation factor IF-3
LKARININENIRASSLRVIGKSGENLGILGRAEAIALAKEANLDLIEISPGANPPVAKIMDYGKFQYEQKRKDRVAKTRAHVTETKIVQIKVTTGEHDLELKAKKASLWLNGGDRIKIDMVLPGRARYIDPKFLEERLERFLNLIATPYRIADALKKSPKGLTTVLEKGKVQKVDASSEVD